MTKPVFRKLIGMNKISKEEAVDKPIFTTKPRQTRQAT